MSRKSTTKIADLTTFDPSAALDAIGVEAVAAPAAGTRAAKARLIDDAAATISAAFAAKIASDKEEGVLSNIVSVPLSMFEEPNGRTFLAARTLLAKGGWAIRLSKGGEFLTLNLRATAANRAAVQAVDAEA